MTGNRLDAGGQPLSWDTITDTVEMMEISFNEDGKMDLTIVIHPDDLAKLEAAGPPTPEQERRHMEVLARKREEWVARKRDRRLR